MEILLHYCWKHRLLPLGELLTTDGRKLEIIDPGMHNHDSGPDFFNAKIRFLGMDDGGVVEVGNVEIHDHARDWYAHGHDHDAAYDNVILHVVQHADTNDIITHAGRRIPQIVIDVPEKVKTNYKELLSVDSYPPCYKVIPQLPGIFVHSWMASLQTERLQQKTEAIAERLSLMEGDWERAFFVTLARAYGFGTNGDAFEQWARNIPLHSVGHHRDNLLQVEAFFFGQAGLLNVAAAPERTKLEVAADEYFQRLSQEYTFLSHKFGLTPIDPRAWKFLRMRPQNFPTIRIAQLALLFHEGRLSLSRLLECDSIDKLRKLLSGGVGPYWQEHYTFGHESKSNSKRLSEASLNVLMINAAIPMLFAYGRQTSNNDLCERAFDLLEALKPEANNITRMWQEVGLEVRSAGDSQALIQLKKRYCDRKDCLRCRIGFEYMRKK